MVYCLGVVVGCNVSQRGTLWCDHTGVTVVESDEEFRKIMAEHQGKKPCIIDFYAIWCGPW